MNLGRLVALWIGRHLLALLVILALLIAGRYLIVPGWTWARAEVAESREIEKSRRSTAEALERLRAYGETRQSQAQAQLQALPSTGSDRLRQRLAVIPAEVEEQRRSTLSTGALAMAGISGRSDRIYGHYRSVAEIALLERERAAIEGLLEARAGQDRRVGLAERRRRAVAQFNESLTRWRQAQARIQQLERRPLAGARNALCRTVRPVVGCDNYRALRAAREARDSAWATNRSALRTIRAVDNASSAIAAANAATNDASSIVAGQVAELERREQSLARAADDNLLFWVRRPILEMLPTALLILLVAMIGPVLVKALLYFIVAPAAGRRRPVRLQPAEHGEAGGPGFRSAVSQRISLRRDETLLVVPEAIQSSPQGGAKATQWLLNSSLPLSSLASGLIGLVRFRDLDGVVEVTATGDPLAEIALVDLPRGSAMVVRPRALRGIIHPLGQKVSVTRHWRFGLSAWLGLQLRYLVFHGPCTLIVQGSRGLRLEAAFGGRAINRSAIVAFSAGLLFSSRRSEAFAAYLMGRQDLLNHSFEGSGYIVYEEMPRAGQRTGLWGRGLAGLGDAALKAVGL